MTTRHVIGLDDFQRALLKLRPDLRKKTVRALQSAALRLQGRVVESIDAAGAVDRGTLRASVKMRKTKEGGTVSVDAPHAAPIEVGTRPFTPPAGPLVRWAMRKFGVDAGEAWRIARAIQRKFSREGIAPRYYFRRALYAARSDIREELAREIKSR